MKTKQRTTVRRGVCGLVLAAAVLGAVSLSACSDEAEPQAADPGASTSEEESTVKRTAVNPWPWSAEMGFNQAELVEGGTNVLYLSGQSAMSADGQPQHAGDLAAQISMSLDNLEAVLADAGMDLSNVVRLNIYTTDVDALFANYGLIAERLGAAGVQPPGSLLGVSRLAFPELMVELEATAVT